MAMDNCAQAYPDALGHRSIDTSIEAAAVMAPKLGRLQTTTIQAIRLAGCTGVTAHELCDRLNMERTSIQPRISELRRKGLIADSKMRRQNASGVSAIVWVAGGEHARI
jgi:hypothetical protein